MRNIWLTIPASLALTAAGGAGVCAIAGWKLHAFEMSVAGGAIALACIVAMLPIVLARGATQLGMAQSALVGSMAHLFVGIALAAVALFGKFGLHPSFFYWLLAFYWLSLIALVATFAAAIRKAPLANKQP
jgi:hypothetical protein